MSARSRNRRVLALIGTLETIGADLELADTELAEAEDQAAWGTRTTSQAESTFSTRHIGDPTGIRGTSAQLSAVTEQRRQLDQALTQAERAINHLRIETRRTLGQTTTNTTQERRCTDMVLDHDGYDYVNRQCGILTHHTRRPDGSDAWRDDGRCLQHGIEADQAEEAARRTQRAQAERRRYHGKAS